MENQKVNEQIEGMCEAHHGIKKTVDYCFCCDRLEFDGREWMPVVVPQLGEAATTDAASVENQKVNEQIERAIIDYAIYQKHPVLLTQNVSSLAEHIASVVVPPVMRPLPSGFVKNGRRDMKATKY